MIKHLPVIFGNARDMKTFTHKKTTDNIDLELITQIALNNTIQLSEFFQKIIDNFVHTLGFAINLCKKE